MRGRSLASSSSSSSSSSVVLRLMQDQRSREEKKAETTLVPTQLAMPSSRSYDVSDPSPEFSISVYPRYFAGATGNPVGSDRSGERERMEREKRGEFSPVYRVLEFQGSEEDQKVGMKSKNLSTSSSSSYLPIAEALGRSGAKVDLFGVVDHIGTAQRSKGTDYFLSLKIIDQSNASQGFSVTFFAGKRENLPQVKSIGDIISLQQILIQVRNGVCSGVIDKKLSSYALFKAQDTTGFKSYEATTKYHAKTCDEEYILRLRLWNSNVFHKEVVAGDVLPMQWLRNNLQCDLVCKVLLVLEISLSKSMLIVWDGTDYPLKYIENGVDLEGEDSHPFYFEDLSLSKEVACEFPDIGSLLRVFTDKPNKELLHLRSQWVMLSNVKSILQSGSWKVMLHPSSQVNILADQHRIVRQRVKAYNDRLASELDRRPFASFPSPSQITVLNPENRAYASLRWSITNAEIYHKFTCIVRVLAACVLPTKDGNCIFRLTLEDPTARIRAFVTVDEKVTFLNGCLETDALTVNLNKLLGVTYHDGRAREDGHRDPPWIWCRLISCPDESETWTSSRIHLIYETSLVG